MPNIAIIPARGGSKRIPKKNIRLFCGKPIIAYSIETALNCSLFDEVMVSTDDADIADIARQHGAKVPFMRCVENANDFAGTADVLIEVLEEYAKLDLHFEWGCCIYPTAPLIKGKHLKIGLKELKSHSFDTVFPVIPFSYPVWRGLSRVPSGKTEMIWPEHLHSRSQDLPEVYHDAGQWYWFKTKTLINQKKLFTQNTGSLVLDEMEVQDIDNLSDWKLAEMKYLAGHEEK
jgi:N-acylneuraminate cytidylyltransferase